MSLDPVNVINVEILSGTHPKWILELPGLFSIFLCLVYIPGYDKNYMNKRFIMMPCIPLDFTVYSGILVLLVLVELQLQLYILYTYSPFLPDFACFLRTLALILILSR